MISTGGTSLVITMIVLGLLANFALQEPSAAAARMVKPPSRVATLLGLRLSGCTVVGVVSARSVTPFMRTIWRDERRRRGAARPRTDDGVVTQPEELPELDRRIAVLSPHLYGGASLKAVSGQAGVSLWTALRWLASYLAGVPPG